MKDDKVKHAMIDLETVSTQSDSGILSIGIVLFDIDGIHDTYHETVDLESCLNRDMHISLSTLRWWMDQDKLARDVAFSGHRDIKEVLEEMRSWFIARTIRWNLIKDYVWSNGAAFDIPILENAMRICRVPVPWVFDRVLCYRTLKTLYPQVPKPTFTGEKHNALDDAKFQAEHTIDILRYLAEEHRRTGGQ